jgi:hypothetical protein
MQNQVRFLRTYAGDLRTFWTRPVFPIDGADGMREPLNFIVRFWRVIPRNENPGRWPWAGMAARRCRLAFRRCLAASGLAQAAGSYQDCVVAFHSARVERSLVEWLRFEKTFPASLALPERISPKSSELA